MSASTREKKDDLHCCHDYATGFHSSVPCQGLRPVVQTGMTGRTRPTNSLKGPALKLHTQLTRRTLDAASRLRCTAGRIPAITLVRVLLWEFLGRGLDECLSFACFTSVGQSVDPHSCSLFFLCPHEGGWLRNPTPGPATSTVTVQGLSANTCYNIGVYQYASSYPLCLGSPVYEEGPPPATRTNILVTFWTI